MINPNFLQVTPHFEETDGPPVDIIRSNNLSTRYLKAKNVARRLSGIC